MTAMAGLIAEVTSMQRRWRAQQECDSDSRRDSGSDVDAKAMVIIAVDLGDNTATGGGKILIRLISLNYRKIL